MSQRILVLQHASVGILGALEQPLLDAGFEIQTWRTFEEPAPPLQLDEIDALIGLGGIMNPDEDTTYPVLEDVRAMLREAVEREIPTLGVCLTTQLMAQAFGGSSDPLGRLRVGFLPVEFEAGDDPLFRGLPGALRPLSEHEYVTGAPRRRDRTGGGGRHGAGHPVWTADVGRAVPRRAGRSRRLPGSSGPATRSGPAGWTSRNRRRDSRRWSTPGSRTRVIAARFARLASRRFELRRAG